MDIKQCEALLDEVNNISQLSQLRNFRHQFQQAFAQLDYSQHAVLSNEIINKLHDSLIVKSIQLAEKEMIGEGHGPPPSPFCYLLLGSGGRQEQTFGSDQDSALVFGDVENEHEQVQQYFLVFANKIVTCLETIGYSPCDGKVQSNVPLWCKSVKDWNIQIKAWAEEADWESIRYLLICADARDVYGDHELFNLISNHFFDTISAGNNIYQRMIDNTIHHRVMVNLFGQLLTVKYGEAYGSIDIKYGAYIPFVNAIRWLSIRHHIKTTSTLNRLEQLYIKKQFTSDEYLEYRKVLIHFLSLRFSAGYEEQGSYYESLNLIHPKRLNKGQVKEIKKSLQIGRKLQKHIQYFIRHSSR